MVKIKIFKRDDWIHISITDNGVGIPKDKLQKLRSDLMSDASTRIGLDNVNKRLTLTYGSESALHIYSKKDSEPVCFSAFRFSFNPSDHWWQCLPQNTSVQRRTV